jgi:prevent-host-death family protein
MSKKIGITEARDSLSEVLNRVAYGGERYMVERRGKPLAAMISAVEYQELVRLLSEVGVPDKVHGIPVHIRFDGDSYFVSDEVLNLYGVGDSAKEAKEDYWTAVQEYYADLSANADSLVAYLKEHLDFLRRVFAITAEMT